MGFNQNDLLKSDDVDKLWSFAQKYSGHKNYKFAIKLLERIQLLKPYHPEGTALLAKLYYLTDDYLGSLRMNDYLLQDNPKDVRALQGKGLALFRLDQFKGGISFLKKAIRRTPFDYLDPYYDLVALFLELGDEAHAKKIWLKVEKKEIKLRKILTKKAFSKKSLFGK